MAEADDQSQDSRGAQENMSDALAMLAEAEAEAEEAEAMAATARARARAARLRREAQAIARAQAEAEAEAAANGDYEYEYVYESDEEDADEAEVIAEDEDETPEPEAAGPRPLTWLNRLTGPALPTIAKIGAVLLIIVFSVLSALMVAHHDDVQDRQRRAAAFAEGARQGAINLISVDYTKATEGVQRLVDSSTGDAKNDFQQHAADVAKANEQSKATTKAKINAAAVQSIQDQSAVVLVSATSHTTFATGAKDESRVWRLQITVADEGGHYKMSKVEIVP